MQRTKQSTKRKSKWGKPDTDLASVRRFFRYADSDSVFPAKAVKDLPRAFSLRSKERQAGLVKVDWEALRELLYESLRCLPGAPRDMAPALPDNDKTFRTIDWALLHVWQFLPEVFDAAFEQLRQEGLLKYMQRQATEVGAMKVPPLKEFAKRHGS